jgi:hypothetical protein
MAHQESGDGPRFEISTIVAVACLAAAVILGLLTFFVPGGFWLLFLAALCLLAAIAVDRLLTRSVPVLQALTEPLVLLALVAVLAIGTFAIVGALSGTSPDEAGPARIAPAPSASAAPANPSSSKNPSSKKTSSVPPAGIAEPAVVQGYVTAGSDVHLRAAPTTESAIIATMPNFATALSLTCYQTGEPVFSDPYWYRVRYAGLEGYVSELWLDAGAQPARTGIPPC